nr:translation initiation factor IF-2-like [Aegilops tauschii subsp. strangulata]
MQVHAGPSSACASRSAASSSLGLAPLCPGLVAAPLPPPRRHGLQRRIRLALPFAPPLLGPRQLRLPRHPASATYASSAQAGFELPLAGSRAAAPAISGAAPRAAPLLCASRACASAPSLPSAPTRCRPRTHRLLRPPQSSAASSLFSTCPPLGSRAAGRVGRLAPPTASLRGCHRPPGSARASPPGWLRAPPAARCSAPAGFGSAPSVHGRCRAPNAPSAGSSARSVRRSFGLPLPPRAPPPARRPGGRCQLPRALPAARPAAPRPSAAAPAPRPASPASVRPAQAGYGSSAQPSWTPAAGFVRSTLAAALRAHALLPRSRLPSPPGAALSLQPPAAAEYSKRRKE